jgi:DNA-binding response OmpR family regulator
LSALILLVNVDKAESREIEALLTAEGYLVVGASSLRHASKLLNSVIPELLIADITLGNLSGLRGLQLAVLSRRDHPNLPVIVTHASPDAELQKQAEYRHMTFVATPIDNPGFLDKVREALGEHRGVEALIRQWPRKRVSIGAKVEAEAAHLVDVSYGGVRLELHNPPGTVAPVFDLIVPAADITLRAERVWQSHARADQAVWWGARVLEAEPAATERWREFVDLTAAASA